MRPAGVTGIRKDARLLKMLLVGAVVVSMSCGVNGSGGSDDAGYYTGSGGQSPATGSGGGNGTGGSAGGGVTGSVCTSMKTWNGNTGAAMAPGYPCIACHFFSIAGTIYPTAHEPNNCDGASLGGVSVVVTGADGQTLTITPNSAGNFYATSAISSPFTAKVVSDNGTRAMMTAQTSGDCNSCHTNPGANGAPGRIMLP